VVVVQEVNTAVRAVQEELVHLINFIQVQEQQLTQV
tara:strand:- start:618 stop:725 length:108 start_codon:yes stop_codon:yes gene_type:complete